MDDIYLIEIRLARTKWRIKKSIFSIGRMFGIEDYLEQHPHVTIFGPLVLNEEVTAGTLLETIEQVAQKYSMVPYIIAGCEKREGFHGSVIAFPVTPSVSLRDLTTEIAGSLQSITTSLNGWDAQPDQKWFHVTIANRLDTRRASKIFAVLSTLNHYPRPSENTLPGIRSRVFSFLDRLMQKGKKFAIRPVLLDETGLRVTVMHGQEILAEYDLLRKQWIRADELRDIRSWMQTLEQFRREAGFELQGPMHAPDDTVFLIADLHLGHTNIIGYCSRPFLSDNADEMDTVLVRNWNYTIPVTGQVYHMGDLRYGNGAPPARFYRDQLNGNITFIRGNHDDGELETVPYITLEHEGIRFLLIHDPADVPPDFNGWVVHGHHHNNDLLNYPFIDFDKKRINVSAEVVGYVPVSLSELCAIIKEPGTARTPILLRYPYIMP
jgi:calcineurin-like phosphoesterase family protein